MQNSKFTKLLKYLSDLDLKKFETEIQSLFKVKQNQTNPVLLNLYGLFFEVKKDLNKAIKIFANCIKLNSNYAPPYFNLGRIYFANNMFVYAINFLEKHIARDQSIFESYDYLAKSYHNDYQFDKSIKILKIMLDNFKDNISNNQVAYIYNFLGANYSLDKKTQISLEYYKKALSFEKDNINALGNIANAFRALGSTEDAIKYFDKALSIDPKNVDIHKDLSVIKKYKNSDDEHLKKMLQIYQRKNISEKDKETLGFAIAKAYDDLQDADKSSQYLISCNGLRRKSFNYEISKDLEELKFHKKIFQNSFSGASVQQNKISIVPIFILGMPRSGSTLIEQIISSHSLVTAGDEISYLADTVKVIIPHKNLNEFKTKFEKNNNDCLNQIHDHYLNKLKSISKNKKFVTDKMPLNFKLVGLIKNAIPSAKIIHCVRDGRDTCLSIYKNNFATQAMPWAYDQTELSNFFNVYVEYMEFWKNIYGKFIYDQSYESLLSDTENQIRKLLNFCDLEFEESCLKFYENKRAVNTVSTVQVRQPIYKSSIKLWKLYENYLPELFRNIKNYKQS